MKMRTTAMNRMLARSIRAALVSLVLASGVSSVAAQTAARALPLSDSEMRTVGGEVVRLADLAGPSGLVLAFWSNSCPWVEGNEARFVGLAQAYLSKGIGFVVVNANDPNAYPDEAPSALAAQARDGKYGFPYLIDAEARLARALGAERTPEIFVFNADLRQVYAGAIDDSPALADKVKTRYLQAALEALLVGQAIAEAQTKSIGCTIKFP